MKHFTTRAEQEAAEYRAIMDAVAKLGPKVANGYNANIERMVAGARAWRQSHPEREVQIVFHHPPGAFVIATISDALSKGFVTTNAAGRELLQAICATGKEEPTSAMVRAAIEQEIWNF